MSIMPSLRASAAVPNDMVKCCWTEERERALIAFYSEHCCLWNKKSENHSNRQLRLRLLEVLSSQLSDATMTFSVDDIKCKFKNLRTVFNREYKSVQASRMSDKLHLSKWKHYQQLLFLCESCDEDESLEEEQVLRPVEDENMEPESLTISSVMGNHSSSYTRPNRLSRSYTPSDDTRTSCSAAQQLFHPVSSDTSKASCQTPGRARTRQVSTPRSCCSDSRLSVDSRCHWSDTKVQQLILFYSEHSSLWNHRSESYKNRQLKQSLLELLSRLLSDREPVPFTVKDIKTKFRNLRTIFQREHKAVTSNKTCGSEDFYLPKWKHYQDLMFLCDSCGEEESEELCFQRLDKADKSLETFPSPTPSNSQRSSPPSSPSMSSSHPEGRGRKRVARDLLRSGSEVLDLMRAFCQSQPPSPHTGFLKYVEECLNETPPDKVKKLKKKIIEMIHSVSEEV
ncbi:hypothetical protein fugu_019431 [Takifugu bimaculatus]|uniref:MADF domain-containing protein n=1 Tax=Takifugu bimaculatus TaxID=433685 RepID=A0A4Z2BKB3_9TELE|nr:hypothetical protein fugu_019431 [Takifugu bimaculatus]